MYWASGRRKKERHCSKNDWKNPSQLIDSFVLSGVKIDHESIQRYLKSYKDFKNKNARIGGTVTLPIFSNYTSNNMLYPRRNT